MNDKIVPAIIEHEGIKYVAVQFHVDAIDENRMLWIENEKLLRRIDKAIEMFNNENLNKYYSGMSYEFEIGDFKQDLLDILRGEE